MPFVLITSIMNVVYIKLDLASCPSSCQYHRLFTWFCIQRVERATFCIAALKLTPGWAVSGGWPRHGGLGTAQSLEVPFAEPDCATEQPCCEFCVILIVMSFNLCFNLN